MGAVSLGRAIAPNVAVLAVTALFAEVITRMAGVDASGLSVAYLMPAIGVAIIALMSAMMLSLIAMAIRREDKPAQTLILQLPVRSGMLLLPGVIQPLFFASFTAAKTSIAPLMSFTWDGVFTAFDAAIFDGDPWLLTHASIGSQGSHALELFYTTIWGVALVFSQPFIAMYASRRAAGTFFLALNLTWLIGGLLLAFSMPAAGPIFAHLFDPTLTDRFKDLHTSLARHIHPDGPIFSTQQYLAAMLEKKMAEEGGGISAMPSMHVATAMIYVLAAQGTRWFWPAIVFTVLTCIGSVHFGYHYAVDGIVAIVIAGLCWRGAENWFARSARSGAPVPGIAQDMA